jgi:nucleotide-binding universal stress UspA family protein
VTQPDRRPVVVGVDGSGPARQAAAWAAQEADMRDVPLLIACVLERVPPGPPLVATGILDRCATVARIVAPDRTPLTGVWFGRPADVLGRLDAGLLVVGHHGSGGALPALGGTALRLAGRYAGALAVVRTAPGRPLPDRGLPVVVAVDGRPGSAALVRHAADLAALRDARLTVLHVWHERLHAVADRLGHREPEAHRHLAEAALAEIAAQLATTHPGLPVHAEVERGRPGWSLLEHTDDAQLVLLGRHRGAGVGARATLLLQAAACPVLVVDPIAQATLRRPA